MSGVIKQHDARAGLSVRAMRQDIPAHPGRMDPALARLALAEEEIERLQGLLAQKDEEAAELRAAAQQAFEDGRAQGAEEGQAIGAERRAAVLEQLEVALSEANESLAKDFAQLERLAPLLARAGLERMFEASEERVQFVTEAIQLQLARVDQASLVQAEVSPEDFADPADLEALPVRLGAPRLRVVIKDDLSAGEARLRLTLGGLEVGPGQQMKVLAEVLDSLAREPTE